jgi:hypothetical protein
MYVIYNQIDTNYYGNKNEKNNILEKVKQPVEEEMQARVPREW